MTMYSSRRLEFGVPQGSILGPLLFTLYTTPIQDIISAHTLDCMFYANDSHLYIIIVPLDQRPALNTLQSVLVKLKFWNGTL